MSEAIELGDISISVTRKGILNVHLNMPPTRGTSNAGGSDQQAS